MPPPVASARASRRRSLATLRRLLPLPLFHDAEEKLPRQKARRKNRKPVLEPRHDHRSTTERRKTLLDDFPDARPLRRHLAGDFLKTRLRVARREHLDV